MSRSLSDVQFMEANVEEEWPETCHIHFQMYNSTISVNVLFDMH